MHCDNNVDRTSPAKPERKSSSSRGIALSERLAFEGLWSEASRTLWFPAALRLFPFCRSPTFLQHREKKDSTLLLLLTFLLWWGIGNFWSDRCSRRNPLKSWERGDSRQLQKFWAVQITVQRLWAYWVAELVSNLDVMSKPSLYGVVISIYQYGFVLSI